MSELLAAFVVFGLVIIGMAVGVIFSDRRLKGSCGGLNAMSDQLGQPLCECGAEPGSCGGEEEGQVEKEKEAEQVLAKA